MMRTGLLLSTVLLLVSGCYHGPDVDAFPPAQTPRGIAAAVTLSDGTGLEGELLAVREDGLVVATADVLWFVAYEHIRAARFEEKRSLRIGAGRAPEPAKQDQLRLMSRFPQGLEGDVLARLLAVYGQNALQVIP